jgi:hypothetical protein
MVYEAPSECDLGHTGEKSFEPGRALLRGEQDENSASIRMRKCRWMRDEGRA